MATTRTPKTTPVSIRLTDEERTRLSAHAGERSLSDYIRERLFGGDAQPRREKPPAPAARDLAHILAKLGQSELGPSLREIARAARAGALPVSPELEETIRSACHATVQLRADLMQALGLKEGSP